MGVDDKTWIGTKGCFDARVISKVRGSGAIIVGKNKTSEFAVHEPTDTLNPIHDSLSVGTSSSGSAAAVAANHVAVSFASQTAGSIARPASYCGVIGFKPSFGEIPRTGVLKTTETFDTVGLIGNSIANIRSVFEVARVSGENHPTHRKRIVYPGKIKQIRFALGEEFDNATPFTRDSVIDIIQPYFNDKFEIDFLRNQEQNFQSLREIHENIYAKEISYFLAAEMERGNISTNLRHFLEFGTRIPIERYRTYLELLRVKKGEWRLDFDSTLVVALSAADEAPKVGCADKLDSNLFWTALGLPQVSLPLLKSKNGFPIGISLIGPYGSDDYLLDLSENLISNNS
jgi:Asp-tRNA(Asn)/Glu-tRNA(Gln) amidotransferase A subunit family amidase